MSEHLTIEHPAAALHAQLCTAKEAEAAAERAVGDAQLAALRGGGNVPGGLLDALQAARRHRQALEAGLRAADRQQDARAADAHTTRRAKRLKEVAAAIDMLDAALIEIDAGLLAFAATGAGQRAQDALLRIRQLCGDATETALTPAGWVVASALPKLRSSGVAWVNDLAAEGLVGAMSGEYKPGSVGTLSQMLRRRLMTELEAQPAEWPSS